MDAHRSFYDANNHRVNTDVKEVHNLIPPIRKHAYAPDIDPSTLIDDEVVFKALTGIN